MPRTNERERVMIDLNERLKSSVARLTDTAMMTTQYPSWLCSEMEKAAELHVDCIAALSAEPDAVGGGDVRAQFEAWAHDNAFATNRDDTGFYLSEDTYGAWIAWQHLAARQPVGVKQLAELIEDLAGDVESCVSDACGYLASDNGWRDYGIYRDDATKRYHALPDRIRAIAFPPSPAAVPVDVEKPNLLLWQLHNQLQHLVRAGRYLADRVVETRGAQCMDDFDHELNQAEKLLATHPQPSAAKDGE